MAQLRVRQQIDYNRHEKISIARKLQILSLQIEDKSDDGINTIFPNQDQCGEEICKIFKNQSIVNCLVYGMTQTGKTGCMTALIQHFVLSNLIPITNIYIITGLSDKEWKKDTKNRMPDSINERVFHRANLPQTFFRDINEKKNFLIIMDEIQIACEENQTIHKTFEKCGFYDLDFLLENDIKLVQFSATPDGNINDISDWKEHSAKVKLSPGVNYYGPKEALVQGRVRQFKDLTKLENILEVKTDVETYKTPRYHLIRVPNKRENRSGTNNQSVVISNFKRTFSHDCDYNTDYLKTKKGDINDILKIAPLKHTFVFYCEILRCAKTQFKKFTGISYERFTSNINDSTIMQGTFGRTTGYDDNGDSICYTNIPSLENYIELWENNMEFKKGIKWNTKTTHYETHDDITYSTGTFNSVKHITQLKDGCSEKNKEERGDPLEAPVFEGEDGQKKMKKWFEENLKKMMPKGKRGPSTRKIIDGFYKGSIRHGMEILSTEKVEREKRWGFGEGPGIRSYACYKDITDPTTLQWRLFYYTK